ncbi:MAG: hypothetical protein QOD83_2803 [Solirubrobacteraceae bacterium]|nr:hypothetical protein [Solirubrobacteraceae bacterium]
MQFTGIVKSYDADEGVGYIVREPDRHEILVRSSGLALGVQALYEATAWRSTSTWGPTRRREM